MGHVTTFRRAGFVFAVAALLWLSPLAFTPLELPYWIGGEFSDLRIAHLPNALYLRRSLIEFGQLPLWNSQILAGTPFLADPLAGVWYPPLWLLAMSPTSLMVNLLLFAHLVWAGVGMWGFARTVGLRPGPATVAGLAFSGTPKLIGQIGLGHLTLVCAIAWMPWLLLSAELAGRALNHRSRQLPARSAIVGGLLGVTFLIDPRWAPPAFLLVVAYLGNHLFRNRHNLAGQARPLLHAGLAGLLVGSGLAAALALPLLEFVPLTTRATLTANESLVFSLPTERLLGLFIADPIGWPEWTTYVGAATILLLSLAPTVQLQNAGFWLAVLVAGWLLALGDSLPFARELLSAFPGIGWLRVPPRLLFFSAFAASVLAGCGAEALESGLAPGARRLARLATAAIASGFLFMGVGVWMVTRGFSSLVPALVAVSTAGFISLMLRAEKPGWAFQILPLLLVFDLAWFASQALEARAWPETDAESGVAAVIQAAAAEAGSRPAIDRYRVFSPSYAIPQDLAARSRLELVDGVNPLQLSSTWGYMAAATGFAPDGYSVTLPPFPTGDPLVPWGADLDPQRLGLLNVAFVVSAYPLEIAGAHQAIPTQNGHLYALAAARPRAWVEDPGNGDPSAWRSVEDLAWTPNRIQLRARGPGRLVLSEVQYPGWRAESDGEILPIHRAYGLLRSVELPPGEHTVIFAFRPRSILLGTGLFAFAAIALALMWWRHRR